MTLFFAASTALAALALVAASPEVAAPAPAAAAPVLAVQTADDLISDDEVVAAPEARALLGGGQASYYGRELAGNRTASGERFNPEGMTAAHRTLPLGSRLRVTNKANGRSVVVRVNDRGPVARTRILDMSYGAARELSMLRAGKAMVTLELLR